MVVYTAEDQVEIPHLDLLTFFFDSNWTSAEENTILHVEAANPSNTINKARARDLVKRVAYGLRNKYGIGASGPGKDVVVCTMNGNPFAPIFFYGVVAAGGIFSSASAAFTKDELVRQTKTGDGMVLACTSDHKEKTIQTAKECGIPLSHVIVIEYSDPKEWTLIPIEGDGKSIIGKNSNEVLKWEKITDLQKLQDTVICLLFSSGTTGVPKGVMLTQRNIVASIIISMHSGSRYVEKRRSQGRPFQLRTVGHLPIAHIAGIQQYFLNPIYYGGTVYWMPKYNLDEFIAINKKFQITYLFSVPPIFLQIAKSDKVKDHFDYAEVVFGGAAPMGGDLQKAASAKMGKGQVFIAQTWGLTETTGSVTVMKWDENDDTGSVAPLAANLTLEIKDDNGNETKSANDPGEMVIGGPLVTKGYYKNEKATKEAFANGRFFTGDVGMVDKRLVYIVDRKKELIKYKGLQVQVTLICFCFSLRLVIVSRPPAELEALLMSNDRILDAAVIGVGYEDTEAPRAYVVRGDQKLSEDDVSNFVKQSLAQHKQLRGGVRFIEEVPKSASGKILRKELRQWAQQEKDNNGKAKL